MTREELAAVRDDGAAQLTAAPEAERSFPRVGKSDLLDPRSAAAHTPWIRPLSDYERKETTIVEGSRYG
jgi:hypothetical protein